MINVNAEEALIRKWEPKVQSFLRTVQFDEKEDLAQELRITILKAAKKYKRFHATGGASFHTYLHTAMVNTRNTFFSSTYPQNLITPSPVEVVYLSALIDDNIEDVAGMKEINPFLDVDLTQEEKNLLHIIAEGYTVSDLLERGTKGELLKETLKSLKGKLQAKR